MFSKPFAVAALALACVTAAAGGAYVAVKQNQTPERAQAAVAEAPNRGGTPAAQAVRDTEAVVAPPASIPVEEPRPAAESPIANRAGEATPSQTAVSRSQSKARTEKPAAPRPAPAPQPPAVAPTSSSRQDSPAVPRPETTAPPATLPVEAPRPEVVSAPAAPAFEDLIVPSAAVVGLQLETNVSSERARVEDRVEARVTRDLAVDGRTAIPAGTRVVGSVTLVEKGGKVREKARLGVRFHTLVFADGTELPIRTDPIMREGDSPSGESARKIGGAAVGGAILGAIIGGKKGAIVGGATGAAGGTAVVMTGDRNAATLPVGAVVTVRLSAPLTVSVEKQ
jgi:hypothetical protein